MKKNTDHKKLQHPVVKKAKSNIALSGIILVIFFFVGMYGYRCLSEKVCEVEMFNRFVRQDVTVITPKGAITAEVADTKSSRELGLSGRSQMNINEGLLFVFDVPGKYGFWMKDMLYALDIVWINQNGVVVEIERNVTPESYPKTFMNKSPASYVLELNGGVAEKQGLYIGSKIKIVE